MEYQIKNHNTESLAMVISPYQKWDCDMIFIETGLDKGTIFADLDKPFFGYKINCGDCGINVCRCGTGSRISYTRPGDISRKKTGCN